MSVRRASRLLAWTLLVWLACPVLGASTPDRGAVSQRASEIGAWWMLVQTTCDQATAHKLLEAMNGAMVVMGNNALQPVVAERIEDPHLDDKSRAQMESVMRQAMAARQQADEMMQSKAALAAGKQPAGGLQRKEWQVARPIKSAADLDLALKDTERALGRMCEQGVSKVRAALLDPDQGLVKTLR